jgi:hypothetical protein
VTVAGKGGAEFFEVRIKKTNASEPLRTCRKNEPDVETRIETLSREAGGGNLSTAPLASGMKAA